MQEQANSESPHRWDRLGSVLFVLLVFLFFLITTFVLVRYVAGSFQGRPALYIVWLSGALWGLAVLSGILGSGLGRFGAGAQRVATALSVGIAIVVAILVARVFMR